VETEGGTCSSEIAQLGAVKHCSNTRADSPSKAMLCPHSLLPPSHPITCHPAVVTGNYARMQSQKVQHSEMSDDEILASNDDEEVHRVADSMQHTV